MKYSVVLYWSDIDAAFLAEVPDLPGCMADGETMQEALKQAEVVAQIWIETAREEGIHVPEPTGRPALQIDQEQQSSIR